MSTETFESWAVVELMGHRKLVGFCTEVELAGGKMLRIDIPGTETLPAWSEFHGNSSIYGVTPVSEDVARQLLAESTPRPWFAYMLPTALPPQNLACDDSEPAPDLEGHPDDYEYEDDYA